MLRKHICCFLETEATEYLLLAFLCIDNIPIKTVEFYKFLGVHLYKNWSSSVLINGNSNKISKTVGVISRIHYKFNSYILYTLYNTMMLPYCNYWCIVWGANYPDRWDHLLKLHKLFIWLLVFKEQITHLNISTK
jgi:hypothetical protein